MFANKLKLAEYCEKFPLIVFYQGNYQETPTYSIIEIVERDLAASLKRSRLKVLMYLVIEALQNIERYSSHTTPTDDYALIYSDGKHFYIYTQNVISNSKIGGLKERLDAVISKSKEELDETYQKALVSDVVTEKGAGLGLIDLARKSNNQLFYEFSQKDDNYSAYSLGFAVPLSKEDSSSAEPDFEATKSIIATLRSNFKDNKSTLFYGGDFTNNFVLSLLNLLKTVKKEDANSQDTRMHHILIELTQNIRRHGSKENNVVAGQLSLEWKEKGLAITTYNLIEEAKRNKLCDKIDLLNQKGLEELKEYNKERLADFTVESGVGLIDVAIFIHPEKIVYQTNKKSNFVYELILHITLSYE